MNKIELLEWDSNFFGYKIGRLDVKETDKFDFDEFKYHVNTYKLVYIFSKNDINGKKIKLADKRLTFHQDITLRNNANKYNIESFLKDKHSLHELIELSLESGIYSRFKKDKHFKNGEYEKLYREWIIKSIDGIIADNVLVSSINDKNLMGFISLSKNHENIAEIGLIAVSEKARGLGLGTELVNESIQLAYKAGAKTIQVVTQLDNSPAINLYKKTNFKLKDSTNIYHYWNI